MDILIVDDEPGLAESLAILLGERGHRCTPASSAAEALDAWEGMSFDALVTDYAMPGISGLELAGRVRESHPQAAIVMFTAYGSTFYGREERELDVDAVVQKPVAIAQLEAVIRRAVRQRKAKGSSAR